jgi:hypothetical protein
MDRATSCPRCGAADLVAVIYGYPDADLFAREERGEVVLGGCVVTPDAPALVCRRCGAGAESLAEAEARMPRRPPPPA